MNKEKKKILPMIFIILDGWGLSKEVKGNAVRLAKTPTMDGLLRKYANTELCASGKCVGLLDGQPGNSEAGHMNIGAGRIVEQDDLKITRSINDGTFFRNAAFHEAIRHVKKRKSQLHILGMISSGQSPHCNPEHLNALLKFARENGINNTALHLFTDGRDSPKYASLKLVQELKNKLQGEEKISTVMGRFYAMDRKKEWSRTEMAYNALVLGRGRRANTSIEAITEAYNRGESDEYIEPYVIFKQGKMSPRISHDDSIIFFNLRSDRARQLAKAFVQYDFNKHNKGAFKRKKVISDLLFVAMTDFGPDLDKILTSFPSTDIKETLPMRLKSLKQLYIAETEKYAHVTYFFNGGYSGSVAGEDQFMIPSPNVKFYNATPAMSSEELTKKVISDLNKKNYDFTLLNFAAPDMIGHTGDLEAGKKCVEILDKCLARIVKVYLKKSGTVIISADHGNLEEMINLKTGEIDTEHSTNHVPFIIINNTMRKKIKLNKKGTLADIAPTILDLLNMAKPKEMSGKSLIKK